MKSIAKVLGAATLCLALVTTTARAQSTPGAQSTPITWNGGVGLSLPSPAGYSTGFNLRFGASIPLKSAPIWIRPEVGFDHFSWSCGYCKTLNLYSFGADAGYTFKTATTKIKPYVLGGLQITHEIWSASVAGVPLGSPSVSFSHTKLGVNLGGGITFPISSQVGYVELRWQDAGSGFDMFPITFGLRF